MASDLLPTSRWCKAAFCLGLVSLAFGLVSVLLFVPDLLILYVGFGSLTLIVAIIALIRLARRSETQRGRSLAWWGLSFPSVFFVIASVLMPAT
jgi:tellurite resistance protein TehA-like permease